MRSLIHSAVRNLFISALLVTGISPFAGSTARAQLGCDPNVPNPEVPALHGSWEGPWIFHSENLCAPGTNLCLTANPCVPSTNAAGIAHAILLPRGDKAGQVLFVDEGGRVIYWKRAQPDWLNTELFCSPYPGPDFGTFWGASCAFDLFCSAHSPDGSGRIVFGGGGVGVPGTPGVNLHDITKATVVFNPLMTTGAVDPWIPGPLMQFGRFYPTVLTMQRSFNGDALVLGGTENALGGSPVFPIAPWERLYPVTPQATHACLATPVDLGVESITAANQVPLEYYPRAHQLASATGEIFIAGDTQPGLVQQCSNPVGATWFITPPTTAGQLTGSMSVGPVDSIQGTPRDRYYGSSVLLHQLPENGGTNRVLIFGGSSGCEGPDPACCSGVNGSIIVRSDVKELVYAPGSTPAGSLVNKAALRCPRVFSNAVILPTGDVFISRGSATDPHNDAIGPSQYEPHAYAELYSPSASRTNGSGSSAYTAAVPDHFVNFNSLPVPCTDAVYDERPARVYHHIALLLKSGEVLVAGGDQVPHSQSSPQCGMYGMSSFSGEVYKPPYLHQSFSAVIGGPESILYRGYFDVNFTVLQSSTAVVDRVVLIRTGSVTHHQDYSQLYVELPYTVLALNPSVIIQQEGGPVTGYPGVLRAQAPASTLASPGYYLLFVVFRDGTIRVPSGGQIIKLE